MITIDEITKVVDHIQGLKVVVFDLDDTLYGEKEYVKSGYHAVAKVLSQIEGAEKKLWSAFEQKKSAIDSLLQEAGVYTEELQQKCLQTYREHQPNIHFYPQAEELLVSLRKQGYMLGVITDGRPEGQRAKIKALRLEDYVDYIIITDELGGIEYRKPNDKAFKWMQEHFDVEFHEMCYIGDNIRKDFIAPEGLGMRAIYFKNKDGLY